MSLEWACELCKAPKGVPCHNSIDPALPLSRDEHYARSLRPGRSIAPKDTEPNPMMAPGGSQGPKRGRVVVEEPHP